MQELIRELREKVGEHTRLRIAVMSGVELIEERPGELRLVNPPWPSMVTSGMWCNAPFSDAYFQLDRCLLRVALFWKVEAKSDWKRDWTEANDAADALAWEIPNVLRHVTLPGSFGEPLGDPNYDPFGKIKPDVADESDSEKWRYCSWRKPLLARTGAVLVHGGVLHPFELDNLTVCPENPFTLMAEVLEGQNAPAVSKREEQPAQLQNGDSKHNQPDEPPLVDGPIPPDKFRWDGAVIEGLQATPWRLLDVLWKASNKVHRIDELGGPVWRDHAIYPDETAFGSARKRVNEFLREGNVPYRVKKNGDYAVLQSQTPGISPE